MGRLLKYLFFLALLGVAGVAVYALFADLPAPVREITRTLEPPAGVQ